MTEHQPFRTIHTDLENAPVLITGGASGIGAALAEAFARQGSKVAFIDIAAEQGRALAAELSARSRNEVHFLHADLRDTAAIQRAVDDAAGLIGNFRVLVNNAALDDRHDADTLTETMWDDSQAINLRQVFFVTQAAVPHMRAGGGGAIVNFSSIAFLLNMGELPSYAAAKAGIIGLTRSLAGKLGPDNIRVNAILPGMIATERQKRLWLTDDSMATMVGRQCIGRVLTADDMTGPCLFLASASSGALSAQAIIADGGIF